MAWTTPRTWVASEFVEASDMNEQVRDNLDFLGDWYSVEGNPKTAIDTFAYSGSGSAGNRNAAGGGDTELTGYEVSIPASYMAQDGDEVFGAFTISITRAEAGTFKLDLGAIGKVTVLTSTAASQTILGTFRITRLANDDARILWNYWYGATAGGSPLWSSTYGTWSTPTWTNANALKVYVSASTEGTIVFADYFIQGRRSKTGDTANV